MKAANVLGGCLTLLVVGGLVCGADVTSGLQPGKSVTPFNVLNVNGPSAGKTNCQI